MQLSERIFAFLQLGKKFSSLTQKEKEQLYNRAKAKNAWFTFDNIDFSIQQIANNLTREKMDDWLQDYSLSISNPKNIGLVTAGNIPLVGFHDFISVLLSGHNLMAKLSSQDEVLMKYVAQVIIEEQPEFKNKINFVEKLNNIDAIIATGSNNSSRYFEYYFGKYPNIIRKNRTSVAVLTGRENDTEYQGLGEDIFRYFGLGCRNVAKIYVPQNFNPAEFIERLTPWQVVNENHKYANNYDYNRSVYLLKQLPFWEGGYFLMLETEDLYSPLAVLYFEKYHDLTKLKSKIKNQENQLQCVVGNIDYPGALPFGQAQKPAWKDYADNLDTMKFLNQLH